MFARLAGGCREDRRLFTDGASRLANMIAEKVARNQRLAYPAFVKLEGLPNAV
jgi:hypothetical protein